MAAAGMDAAAVEAAMRTRTRRTAKPADDVELEADDEGRAVTLFLGLETQWHWTPVGVGMGISLPVRKGLMYQSIDIVARHLEIGVDPRVMADVMLLEREALAVFAEKAARP